MPCCVFLCLSDGVGLAVIVRQVQLRLQVMQYKSRHQLLTKYVLHNAMPQRLAIVVRIDVVLVVGKRSGKLHRAVLAMLSLEEWTLG